MKKIIASLFLLLSLTSVGQPPRPMKVLPLIPLPREVKYSDDNFVLSAQTKIVLLADGFQHEVDYINNF
ncbi:MAG: hypothetical protein NTX97_08770, partial [Bacteroidetes bacterium]|nr:hypothetical protein [Bacteroidota bacterium]